MLRRRRTWMAPSRLLGVAVVLAAVLTAACSKDSVPPTDPARVSLATGSRIADAGPFILQRGDNPPSGLVQVDTHGSKIQIWPYTCAGFDGTPVDPINLIFVGTASPRTIRAALMNLDGNRTAYGIPDVAPFNQRWDDGYGDVQTAYADGEGWTGSVIQLALGGYGPLRVHLRLFRTAGTGGDDLTLGAAHFEVLVPGTADHRPLSWNVARDLIVADFLRAGLVLGDPEMTAPITATPSYRTIDYRLYNGLPVEVRALIHGPLEDQTADVPIENQGNAAILVLGGVPENGAGSTQSFTLNYDTLVPKPVCSDGPYDYIYIQGPVTVTRTTTIDAEGTYGYEGHLWGQLTLTPMDVTTIPPTPSGAPYRADIAEDQSGTCAQTINSVSARMRQIAGLPGKADRFVSDLKVALSGEKKYRVSERCLEPEP
jgi:hypothetical protein